jgi:hypothetical protein
VIGAIIALLAAQQAPSTAPTVAPQCPYLDNLKEEVFADSEGDGLVSLIFEADLERVSKAADHVRDIAWLNPGDFVNSGHTFEPDKIPIIEDKGLIVVTWRIDGFSKESAGGLYDAACGFAKEWKLGVRGWSVRVEQEVIGGSFAVESIK